MGEMVIAAYRPKKGKEQDLLALVREHVPALRKLGLATSRPALAMRAKDGTVLEIFEWASKEAVDRAHHDPVVREIWGRFEKASDFVPLAQVPGIDAPFTHFEPIDL